MLFTWCLEASFVCVRLVNHGATLLSSFSFLSPFIICRQAAHLRLSDSLASSLPYLVCVVVLVFSSLILRSVAFLIPHEMLL